MFFFNEPQAFCTAPRMWASSPDVNSPQPECQEKLANAVMVLSTLKRHLETNLPRNLTSCNSETQSNWVKVSDNAKDPDFYADVMLIQRFFISVIKIRKEQTPFLQIQIKFCLKMFGFLFCVLWLQKAFKCEDSGITCLSDCKSSTQANPSADATNYDALGFASYLRTQLHICRSALFCVLHSFFILPDEGTFLESVPPHPLAYHSFCCDMLTDGVGLAYHSFFTSSVHFHTTQCQG